MTIRWMVRSDINQVLDFEKKWKEEAFISILSKPDHVALVYEQGATIKGFIVYQLQRQKLVVIRLGFMDQLFGYELLVKLASKLSSHRINRIVFNVDEEELQIQLLLKASGFVAVAIDEHDEAISYRFVLRTKEPTSTAAPF